VNEAAKQQPQVQIKADEKELLGQYSNLVMIHHNAEEFTLHFIYVFPNVPQGKLVSSNILSPGHSSACGARWARISIATKRSSAPSVRALKPPLSLSSASYNRPGKGHSAGTPQATL